MSRAFRIGYAPLGELAFYAPVDATTEGDDDYATLRTSAGSLNAIPNGWGDGEHGLGFKFRADPAAMAVGTAINNWPSQNPAVYSAASGGEEWWYRQGFVIDMFNNSTPSDGSFGFGLRNSGRPVFTYGDGAQAAARNGGVHGVYSGSAASLIDNRDHWIEFVARNTGASDRRLEMWVDFVLLATETSGARTAMYTTYWSAFSGWPQPGFYLGAEKISALGGDVWHKGACRVWDLCFWTRAKSADELGSQAAQFSPTNRVRRFRMQEPDVNDRTYDDSGSGSYVQLEPQANPGWVQR